MIEKVEIFDISYDGAGVGKTKGKICFVPKTLPGEIVQVDIIFETEKFCVGNCQKILKENQNRIKAFCPYFDICGGCDFQHCTYEQEQKIKQKILAKELEKVGFFDKIDFVPCSGRFSYRNKIKFEVKEGKLGYFKPKSHEFFEVKTCPICDKEILGAIPLVEQFLKENKLGSLKNVYLKNVDEKILICFLFDKNAKFDVKKFQKTAVFDHFLTFFAFGEVLESDKTKLICVSSPFEKNMKISLGKNNLNNYDIRAFSQVNDEIAEKLYSAILEKVGGKRVINAYSGQGLLTSKIAEKAKFVYGIELQKSAHEKANQICSKQKNVRNICGKVENELQKIEKDIDLIVLDPARAGCQKTVLKEIVERKIAEIVYVSCNFATLVRDLKILKDFYIIEEIKIFDMFPCTANLETFVVMKKI